MGRAKKTTAQDRLSVRSCDPLGWLIKEFKAKPTTELAFGLLEYQHGKAARVDSKGNAVTTVIKVAIGSG